MIRIDLKLKLRASTGAMTVYATNLTFPLIWSWSILLALRIGLVLLPITIAATIVLSSMISSIVVVIVVAVVSNVGSDRERRRGLCLGSKLVLLMKQLLVNLCKRW